MKKTLFENGSEKVVMDKNERLLVTGAGYEFRVFGLEGNDFMTTGGVRKETKEFLSDYMTKTLSEDKKESFITEILKSYVVDRDEEWFEEIKEDYEDWEIADLYYHDMDLSSIIEYLYDIFCYDNTRAAIDFKARALLGWYADSVIAKIDDSGYYFMH